MDFRESDADIARYVLRYAHLNPPMSPALRHRMAWDVTEDVKAETPEQTQTRLAWLTPADYALDPVSARDRARGALLGLAIGDAVGTTLEFRARDEAEVHDMVGGGPFGLLPGEWTDDTSMALCLGYSLAECGAFNPDDVARRLVSWYRRGAYSMNGRCFDIGGATRRAVEGYERAGFAWGANWQPHTAGNGSLIRLAPLAVFGRRSLAWTWRRAAFQSAITHSAQEAKASCQLFAVQLHHALNGATKDEALAPKVLPLGGRLLILNAGEYKSKRREQIRSSGYVIDTLEAALWSVWTTTGFEAAVLTAANLADDADSVAATAGQLAGALYGAQAIPARWRERVAWSDRLVALADALFDRAQPDAV